MAKLAAASAALSRFRLSSVVAIAAHHTARTDHGIPQKLNGQESFIWLVKFQKIASNFLIYSVHQVCYRALQSLRQSVDSEGQATFNQWRSHIQRTEFLSSALNLAQYLALRRHDLRNIQAALMPWGLSSLGRIEARVMPNLDAVIATLEVLCGEAAEPLTRPSVESFFEGDRLLRQHTEALFGATLPHRRVRIMVTLPTEAATDYALVQEIVPPGGRLCPNQLRPRYSSGLAADDCSSSSSGT